MPRPPEYPAVEVRLLNDVGGLIKQVSAEQGVPVATLIDGVLRAWLHGGMTTGSAGQGPPRPRDD
jgi:hypothetical protein